MARLYWRVKVNGKWKFTPVLFLEGVYEAEVIKELFDYNQAIRPEEDE